MKTLETPRNFLDYKKTPRKSKHQGMEDRGLAQINTLQCAITRGYELRARQSSDEAPNTEGFFLSSPRLLLKFSSTRFPQGPGLPFLLLSLLKPTWRRTHQNRKSTINPEIMSINVCQRPIFCDFPSVSAEIRTAPPSDWHPRYGLFGTIPG